MPTDYEVNAKAAAALYRKMQTVVARWVNLEVPEWNVLASLFSIRKVEARAHVLLPGSNVHELLFVCEGLLRFYYPAADGATSNKAFIAEDTFAGPLAASSLGFPVLYGVQALEPTTLLVASFAEFVALFEQHPAFDRLGRKLAESLLIHKEIRARSLLQQRARERYLDFIEHHPDLVQRIPQYHIASYLGITDVSLSRLRRALARESLS